MLITCYNFIAVVIAIVIKSFAASAINVFAESVNAVLDTAISSIFRMVLNALKE